jgi:HSP20 family protein
MNRKFQLKGVNMRNALDLWRGTLPWSGDEDFVGSTLSGYSPACEVDEKPDHYLISVDVPGLSKDDVKVEVVGNQLVISGERKHEKTERGGRRSERYYGRFERSFALPTSIDADKIEARYDNGVLELAVPKAEGSKAKTVEIQSGKDGFMGRFLGRGKTAQVKEAKATTEKGKEKAAS